MRLIMCFFFCILLIRCNSNTIKNGSKWYAPNFGVLSVSKKSLNFFPNSTPVEVWFLDDEKDMYKYSGTYFNHCLLEKSSDIFILVEKNDLNSIRLISNNECFSSLPLTSELILYRIPENIDMNFTYISIIEFQQNKFNEIRLSPLELVKLSQVNDYSDDFSVEELIWILFCSGLINNSIVEDRFASISLKLVGDGFHIERVLHRAAMPNYLSSFLEEARNN